MTQTELSFASPLIPAKIKHYPREGTQNRAILDALLRGEKLTPLEALNRYGSLRLGARIFELQAKFGWTITSTMIGKGRARVAQYSL